MFMLRLTIYLDINGYTLFDLSKLDTIPLKFADYVSNYDELEVHGNTLDVNIGMVENIGSMTCWADKGNVVIYQIYNDGRMCFHQLTVRILETEASGYTALSNSTISLGFQGDIFIPTFVFKDSQSAIVFQELSQDLSISIGNFEIGKYLQIKDNGYCSIDYSGVSLYLYFSDFEVHFEIGSDYDEKKKFNVKTDNTNSSVYLRYADEVPSGSNNYLCSCSFDTARFQQEVELMENFNVTSSFSEEQENRDKKCVGDDKISSAGINKPQILLAFLAMWMPVMW